MSPSVCLGAVLKIEVTTPARKEYQSSCEHIGHIFIALTYPGPIRIVLSCVVSYQFMNIKPVAGHY